MQEGCPRRFRLVALLKGTHSIQVVGHEGDLHTCFCSLLQQMESSLCKTSCAVTNAPSEHVKLLWLSNGFTLHLSVVASASP